MCDVKIDEKVFKQLTKHTHLDVIVTSDGCAEGLAEDDNNLT